MVYITAIHMSGGKEHEHIAEVRWRNPENAETGASSRAVMVEWIDGGGSAKVSDGQTTVEVRVVRGPPAYLRTYANGRWSDNLLALPRY